MVKEDVQDERKEVDECEEDWAVVLWASWSKGEPYICTEDFVIVTYDKEVAQQVVCMDRVNKAMKIGSLRVDCVVCFSTSV